MRGCGWVGVYGVGGGVNVCVCLGAYVCLCVCLTQPCDLRNV